MTTVNRSGSLSKSDLIAVSESGDFIYDPEYREFADLNGAEAARYLTSKGFEVVKHFDAGTNGWAITSCGMKLSTNGFLSRIRGNFD